MPVIVTRRSKHDPVMAWLLIIFFFPWAGLLLYLLIGRRSLPRRRVERHARLVKDIMALEKRFANHPNIVRPELDSAQATAVLLAERLGSMTILGGNSVELMTRTNYVIDRLIEDIDNARETVHLLFYIFSNDRTGQRVIDALARAAGRGVTCRILVDAVGSKSLIDTHTDRLRDIGIDMKVVLPVNILRIHLERIDIRNHRKLAVIDGRIGYTGSQNIVDDGYSRRDLTWHDMMVRLTGPIVLELQGVFTMDWYFETGIHLDDNTVFPDPVISGDVAVQALPSGPNYPIENYKLMVVDALHSARRHVTITTPYFVPDTPFLQALQTAALRGVTVDVILPLRYDQRLVGAASRSYYQDLLDAGVHLYLFRDGLLHAKTMSIDDELGFIGTGNFDIRSFELNFELNLVFYGPAIVNKLRREQETYRECSSPLTRKEWGARPETVKFAQNMARLMSPLL